MEDSTPTAAPAAPLSVVVPDEPTTISVKLGYAPPGEDFVAIEKTRTALGTLAGAFVTLVLPPGDYVARPIRRATKDLTSKIKDRPEHFLFVPKSIMDAKGLTLGQVIEARASIAEERPAQQVPYTRAQVLSAAKTLADRFRASPDSERIIVGVGHEEKQDVLFVYTNGVDPEIIARVVPPDWMGLRIILREHGSVTAAPAMSELNPPPPPVPKPRQPEDEGSEAGRPVGHRDPSLAPFANLPPPSRLDSLPTVTHEESRMYQEAAEHANAREIVNEREFERNREAIERVHGPRTYRTANGDIVRTAGENPHGPLGWVGSAMGLPGHAPLSEHEQPRDEEEI